MTMLSSAQAEDLLTDLARQFAQWRQSRTTPARAHSQAAVGPGRHARQVFPCARVAKQLGPDSPGTLNAAATHYVRGRRADSAARSPPTLWKCTAPLATRRRRKWKSSEPMARGCGSRIVKPRPHSSPCSRPFLESR